MPIRRGGYRRVRKGKSLTGHMTAYKRILVVDDESAIRELMLEILSGEGYAVEAVESGPAALERLREDSSFALLFTDIMMPEMDGITLIREARKAVPAIIPVLMTGFASLETARAAVLEGAYDYVLKPFSLGEIKRAVDNAFERHHHMGEKVRLRELNELFDVSERIASMRDEQGLLDFVLDAALERVNAEEGSLLLTSHDGRALELAASTSLNGEHTGNGVLMNEGISEWVAEHAQPLLVSGEEGMPAGIGRAGSPCPHSFISMPIERKYDQKQKTRGVQHVQPRVIAVLNVAGKRNGGGFTERDLRILSIVANHAAAAIENARLIHDIEHAHLSSLQSMALLLEAKDPYTHGHSQRVRDYAVLTAKRMGMSKEDVSTMQLGAMLHDIGKIGVKDDVLGKNGHLTDDEWAMIKQHPQIGYEVLAPVGFLSKEHLALVRSHHERIDGTGYPDGLEGDQLSPLVRVIAVADAFDAMSSSRAYRSAMSLSGITAEIKRCAGAQFDRKVASLFVDLIESGELT